MWRKANPQRAADASRDSLLRRRFGITLEMYDAMLVAQCGRCAICGQPETRMRLGVVRSLSTEHNHDTGKVRGLVCGWCNDGLRYLDDAEWTRRATAYIEESKT